MDIIKCVECGREYESHTKYDRKCPACDSGAWEHVREIQGREPCPHCGHKYFWRSFTACPNCNVTRTAAPGSLGTPEWRERESRLPLTTTETVAGHRTLRMLGLVTGVGHPSSPNMGSTGGRSRTSLEEAESDLRRNAVAMGADAVVGVRHAVYSGGNRSMSQAIGVQLLGTAVTLEDAAEPG